MCRWIKIESDGTGIHCGKGFDYPAMDKKVKKVKKNEPKPSVWPAEPTASVVLNKEKTDRFVKGVKKTEPDKALWRELTALLTKRNEDNIGGPLAFDNCLPEAGFDIHVCALMRDQASIENMIESVYHISPKILSEKGRAIYEREVNNAEWLSWKLRIAVETYRKNVDSYWNQRVERAGKGRNAFKALLHSKATRSYWTSVEKNRHLLMAHVDAFGTDEFEATGIIWRKIIHKAAREAYISACGQKTPRQIRAFALGWMKLFMEKKTESEDQDSNGGEE